MAVCFLMVKCDFSTNMMQTKFRLLVFIFPFVDYAVLCTVVVVFAFAMFKMYLCVVALSLF